MFFFVSNGHSPNKSNNGRVPKFSSDGRFIKTWGLKGSVPGDFDDPHDIFVGGPTKLNLCRAGRYALCGAAFREEAMRRNDAPAAADRVITDADGARARRVMGHRATQ